MDVDRQERAILWGNLVIYFTAFLIIIVCICSPNWYETYPLLPRDENPYGSIGLLEHCLYQTNKCIERKDILKYEGTFWPYRPYENIHFDYTLSMLICTTFTTFCAIALTFLLCFEIFECRKQPIMWLLLLFSAISAILSIASVAYFDLNFRTDKVRFHWCSYLSWVAVFFLLLSNIPSFWLLWRQNNSNLCHDDPSGRGLRGENDYAQISMHPQARQMQMQHPI